MDSSGTTTTNPAAITMYSLDGSFGAILIGTFLGLILYGIALHQSYRYWRVHQTDSSAIRLIVTTLIVLETLHAVMTMHTCYYYLVTHYFQFEFLGQTVWSLDLLFFIASLVAFTSQLFFAKRVSLIGTPYILVTILAGILLTVKLVSSIIFTARGFRANSSVQWTTSDLFLVQITLASATGVDIVLTTALFSVLHKDPTSRQRCDSWYKKMVVYFINTGFLIFLFDLIGFILSVTVSSANLGVWTAVNIVACRLYTNTLLSVLNTRQMFMSRSVDVFEGGASLPLGQNVFARADRLAAVERWNVPQVPSSPGPTAIDIKVTQDVEGDDADATASLGSSVLYAERRDKSRRVSRM